MYQVSIHFWAESSLLNFSLLSVSPCLDHMCECILIAGDEGTGKVAGTFLGPLAVSLSDACIA